MARRRSRKTQEVLSSLVRRFTGEPFKEYETNTFKGSKSASLKA
jgi:hypothetical protein